MSTPYARYFPEAKSWFLCVDEGVTCKRLSTRCASRAEAEALSMLFSARSMCNACNAMQRCTRCKVAEDMQRATQRNECLETRCGVAHI